MIETIQHLIVPIPEYLENPLQSTPLLPNPFPASGVILWRSVNIDLYHYQMELPEGWYLQEEKLSLLSEACNLGHDLANYHISNFDGSEIEIQFLCWVRDAESIPFCPNETVILDENRGIARSKVSDNEYHYENFTRSNDLLYCYDGWAISDQRNGMTVNEIADYIQTKGEINFPVVDRIVMSIHP